MSLQDKKTEIQEDYTLITEGLIDSSSSTLRGFRGITKDIAITSGNITSIGNLQQSVTGDASSVLGFTVSGESGQKIVVETLPTGIRGLTAIVDQKYGAYTSVNDLIGDISSKIPAADVSSITSSVSAIQAKNLGAITSTITGGSGQTIYDKFTGFNSNLTELNSLSSAERVEPITSDPYRWNPNTSLSAFEKPLNVGATQADWFTANRSTMNFSYIQTVEELKADIAKINRAYTSVIVHWSRTFTNQNIGAEELNSDHITLGKDGLQYHYVIRRDGSLQRGRPIETLSEHTTLLDYNTRSIGICFIGGYNCSSLEEDPDEFISAKSLTRSQMTTFEKFCREFLLKYPGAEILGHSDIDPDTNDPGFDVRGYVEHIFNKKSLIDDTTATNALGPSDIVNTELT